MAPGPVYPEYLASPDAEASSGSLTFLVDEDCVGWAPLVRIPAACSVERY